MCRVKGSAPSRKAERCEKCNDPQIRRDRQNLANSVKRVEASIAQESKTVALETPSVAVESIVEPDALLTEDNVDVENTVSNENIVDILAEAPAGTVEEVTTVEEATVPVTVEEVPTAESIETVAETPVQATVASALASELGYADDDAEAQLIQELLTDGSAAKNIAHSLREERLAMGNEAWLLKGEENTPENLAKGLAERQEEVMIVGGLIAERAQAIHGVDVDAEREGWVNRLKDASKEHEKLKADHETEKQAFNDYRHDLLIKHNTGMMTIEQDLPEPDKTEYLERNQAFVELSKRYNESDKQVTLMLTGEDEQTLSVNHKIADANRQAIAELREVGNTEVEVSARHNVLKETFTSTIADTFPDEWVENSNKKGNLSLNRVTLRDQRDHHTETIPGSPYIYSQDKEPDYNDSYYEGWEKRYDKDGNFTGKWHGLKKDMLPEKATPKTASKFKDDGTPKGTGWKKGQTLGNKGAYIPVWIRDNPVDKKRFLNYDSTPRAEIGINISASDHTVKSIIQHEFSHRVESSNPHITVMEEAFIASRTTNDKGKRDRLIEYRGDGIVLPANSKTKEAIRPDNFVDPYMGKEYSGSNIREVLSMGTESVFGGSQGGLIGIGHAKTDHSMRNWILGMYAVA